MPTDMQGRTPLLLLKTKSVPTDSYEEYFATFDDCRYQPVFVPVLEHQFKDEALDQVRHDITNREFGSSSERSPAKYGAIIFTSQRAVEAFTHVVEEVQRTGSYNLDELLPRELPLYVVGPATARGLRALHLQCPILGEEKGNSETLSPYILEHYNSIYTGATKPSILFLVGEQRRDTIPKVLQSEDLAPERRSKVEELVMYETGEMVSFRADFTSLWQQNVKAGVPGQWVVVFSPTGCKAMLESLQLLDKRTGKLATDARSRQNIHIATIGPTTRQYLIDNFGFSPDVCAEKPSPEGIAKGIKAFANSAT